MQKGDCCMKKKIIIIMVFVIVLFCGVGGYFIFGGTDTPKPTPTYAPLATPDANGQLDPWAPYMPPTTLTPNEDGLYEVNVPLSLLGGRDVYLFTEGMLEHPILGERFTDIRIDPNREGLVMVYTEDALHESRWFYSEMILFWITPAAGSPSLIDIIFENELRSEIIVRVNVEEYEEDKPLEGIIYNEFSLWAGLFQLLSGVAPEDWHVTITVRCYDTGELVSREEFPSDDMFDREW